MADIEVTLGARNEASQVLKDFQSQVGQTAQSVEFSLRGLAQLAGATAAVVALVEAGRALATFASSSIAAFDDTNKSAIRLKETLELIPDIGANAANQLRRSAEALEGVTNIDAGKIIQAMTGALRRGADPGQLEDLSEAAIGLSRVFDRDLSSSMRMVEEATKGNFDAFRGLIPQIDQLATNSEKLAAVERLAEAGLNNKAKAARDALEAGDALQVSTSRLLKTVGELLAPIRDVIYRGFVLFFDFLTSQMNPSLEDFDALVGQVRSTVEGFAETIAVSFVTGFTIAESAILDFGKVLQIAVDSAMLQIVRLTEEIPYQLTGMAQQVAWFVENIGAITAVVALGKTTFAEAFADMPTMAERAITDTERALQESIDRTANDLVGGYSERLNQRLDQLKKGFNFQAEIDLKERPGSKNPLTEGLRELQAFESRVLTRGPGTSPIDKLVQNTAEANKHLQAIEQNLTSPSDEPKQEIIFAEVAQ